MSAPRTAGPTSKAAVGGDIHITQHFDNRNADIGVAGRVKQAAAIHKAAVRDAAQVIHEQSLRTPH